MDGIDNSTPYQQPTPRQTLNAPRDCNQWLSVSRKEIIIIILARYVCGVQSLFGLAGWMWPGRPHEGALRALAPNFDCPVTGC